MKIVSACLAGCRCRYDSLSKSHSAVEQLVENHKAVLICPEQVGGLPTPRNPAEIVGGDGFDVLDGNAKVLDNLGNDVTVEFIAGAHRALNLAQTVGATDAVLKKNSPSCGSDFIYDGSFTGAKKKGIGVTAALLLRHGIDVVTEDNL